MESCTICMEENAKQTRTFSCHHGVCDSCISKLRSLSCPFCRQDISSALSASERASVQRRQHADAIEPEELPREFLLQQRVEQEQEEPQQRRLQPRHRERQESEHSGRQDRRVQHRSMQSRQEYIDSLIYAAVLNATR